MTEMLSVKELPSVFSDVDPIAQDDGPNPVCVIDYKPDFVTAYNYMRAVLKSNERSGKSTNSIAVVCVCVA